MPAKNKGIIAYGTDADRLRLEALARQDNRSGSAYLINLIRERYRDLFGDQEPTAT